MFFRIFAVKMITLAISSLLGSVEFYVILLLAAAAIIGVAARPPRRGPAVKHLLAGILCLENDNAAPSVELICNDNGSVTLLRRGLTGMNLSGAVSLAIEVAGFDITVNERIADPRDIGANPVDTAVFTLDFLGAERYHLRYLADRSTGGLVAVTTLRNLPGIHLKKSLQ